MQGVPNSWNVNRLCLTIASIDERQLCILRAIHGLSQQDSNQVRLA